MLTDEQKALIDELAETARTPEFQQSLKAAVESVVNQIDEQERNQQLSVKQRLEQYQWRRKCQ